MKHNWRKREDGTVDVFAWGIEDCNGPQCMDCGYSPCEHCNPDWESEDGCEGKPIITNAQRLRAMTDEQLAGLLIGYDWHADVYYANCKYYTTEKEAIAAALAWLKSPAAERKDDDKS